MYYLGYKITESEDGFFVEGHIQPYKTIEEAKRAIEDLKNETIDMSIVDKFIANHEAEQEEANALKTAT